MLNNEQNNDIMQNFDIKQVLAAFAKKGYKTAHFAYAAAGDKIVERVKVWLGSESVDLKEGEISQNEDGDFVIKIKIDDKTYKAD